MAAENGSRVSLGGAGRSRLKYGNATFAELRRLTREDAAAVLAFEMENRTYFARSITDRGDEFFERFTNHHDALLAQQAAGGCAFHILVAADGSVIGRVNLYDLERGSAALGYRVAERVAGRGVATAAVESVAALARDEYGLDVLVAEVSDINVSSRRVLEKAGFVAAGPTEIGAKRATRYVRDLHRSAPTDRR
jgi:ribosomal-protein-alanine N-acetyltransferase